MMVLQIWVSEYDWFSIPIGFRWSLLQITSPRKVGAWSCRMGNRITPWDNMWDTLDQ
jgi:hypothetical protein